MAYEAPVIAVLPRVYGEGLGQGVTSTLYTEGCSYVGLGNR